MLTVCDVFLGGAGDEDGQRAAGKADREAQTGPRLGQLRTSILFRLCSKALTASFPGPPKMSFASSRHGAMARPEGDDDESIKLFSRGSRVVGFEAFSSVHTMSLILAAPLLSTRTTENNAAEVRQGRVGDVARKRIGRRKVGQSERRKRSEMDGSGPTTIPKAKETQKKDGEKDLSVVNGIVQGVSLEANVDQGRIGEAK